MKLVFVDATSGFTLDRKEKKACGGILNSLTIIPKLLAQRGHDVTVKCSISEKAEVDGVKYMPVGLTELIPKWDVIVLNRNGVTNPIVGYAHQIKTKVVWWLHDIVDMRYLDDASYRKVDKIIALSDYCKTSYSKFYDIPEEKFAVIPNGVDKSRFYPGKYEDRKKYRMIWASAPIKGFIPLEDTWTNVRRHFSSAELLIYASQGLHDKEDSSDVKLFLNGMEELKASVMQPVSQEVLAEKMRGAWALLMPNSYPEICSNLILQAQACGLPVITSGIGSAPEFVKNDETGVVTDFYPHDLWLWIKSYAEATVKLFKDEERHRRISELAPRDVLSWEQVADKWDECLKQVQGGM